MPTRYIARKRARFKGLSGPVNLPYGTVLTRRGGMLYHGDTPVCAVTGQNNFDHFCPDDDGRGKERGALIEAILHRLSASDTAWGNVWKSLLCHRYRRPEHAEVWLWSPAFYTADVETLQAILAIAEGRATP